MKLNDYKKYPIMFLLLNILVHIISLEYAYGQSIQIYSQYQLIDILKNTIFLTDNVILKCKHIELYAKKIMIVHDKENQYLSMVKAYGHPVLLKYNQESECQIVSAQASMVYYNVADNIITFTGNARITQLDSFIQSDSIIYLINNRKIQVFSKKDNKSIIILKINAI